MAALQDLHLDWRMGAEIFASLLVDHDWAVNRANWAYFAGVARTRSHVGFYSKK